MPGVPPPPPPGHPPVQNLHFIPPTAPGYGFPPGPPPGIPPNIQGFPLPLPPGWSEHRAPDGVTPYFYNSHTRESTYTRPTLPILAAGAPHNVTPASMSLGTEDKKKKKEKPKQKVPIPGTTWTRVTTTDGNVFYFEKESKKSEWTVPEEIKDAVADLEDKEKKEKEETGRQQHEKIENERIEKLKELEKIKAEVEEERKKEIERKRKKRDQTNSEDGVQEKKTKLEEDDVAGPEGEEDEESWMKAVAAEFAEKDAQAQKDQEDQDEKTKQKEAEAAKKVFAVPEKVNVSMEEGRALFKALLIEKDISPFAPWEHSLPLFINDPRYVLLSSMKDRREVYEEYCREAGRAKRLKKNIGGNSTSKNGNTDPEKEYKGLLAKEVTSTRMRWDDFRKNWKKDRRFYAFGRDDHQREKVFKQHLRDLGERKRAAAQKAEEDFYSLLKESSIITSSSQWSLVKRNLSSDPRYDAVGSSSLREDLFNIYTRRLSSGSTVASIAEKCNLADKEEAAVSRLAESKAPQSELSGKKESKEEAATRKIAERKTRAEASLGERENKVREERQRIEMEMKKSRAGADKEEGERLFGSLLVDVLRDNDVTWQEATNLLSPDPRFNHPSLGSRDKMRLFEQHIARISSKRSNALDKVFEQHTPALDAVYDDVYPHIVEDPAVKRLGLQGQQLEDRWAAWCRTWETNARHDFDKMLGENSFVDFWSKMRKKQLDENALKVNEQEEREEGEGLGEGGSADLTKLAKQIDLGEIKMVLMRDRRYRIFDHVPEKREQWLRDYLDNVEAASGSKTIFNIGRGKS
ncbi:uncharacterized protein L203_103408 [Cryptococcus depauperatus CBS 7841]|uniref:Transcription elongation regulator 1 n=1 Tax=Cryptococcus depauperatus CBS 7841 TaxID=1295531 RepID=A0AAJ8JTJ8_9TREE